MKNKIHKGRFLKGRTFIMTDAHRQAIGEARKKAWEKTKRPIGDRREKNGKEYEWIETKKGWRHWVQVNAPFKIPNDINVLTSAQKSRLRKKGYDIPYIKRGVPKGFKRSAETRKKMSVSSRKYLIDVLAVAREQKERIRKSLVYRMWREAVYKRDNYTCQHCGARSAKGVSVSLESHHVKSFSKYPSLRFKVGNGRTLCVKCHRLETSKEMKNNKHGRQKT